MASHAASPTQKSSQFRKGRTIPNLALPNSYHPPPQALQSAIVSAVALDIATYFFSPEPAPRFGPHRIVTPMVMPEAAVYLHYCIVPPQYDIRPARETTVVQPEPKPTSVESPPHKNFRARVLVLYRGHVSTPAFRDGWSDHWI